VRPLAITLTIFALLLPRPADACCVNDPSFCYKTGRWLGLAVRNDAPLPRDGVLLFSGSTHSDLCVDALAKFLIVDVRRDGQPIAGVLELADGSGHNFVWRPAEPWMPGSGYHVHVEIDNEAIGPPADEEPVNCPGDCLDEPLLVLDADFTVSPEFSPPLPPLPAPQLSLHVSGPEPTMTNITCCTGVVPVLDCCGPCDVSWDGPGCVELFEFRRMQVALPPQPVAPELAGQLLYELRADDQPIGRQISSDALFPDTLRNTPACLQLVAIHLGNGETRASETICPLDQLAQQLGVHPVDVPAELACADPVRCGQPNDTWDLDACVPYDPQFLPPPPSAPSDLALDAPCPMAQGPWLPSEPADDPTTSTSNPDPATAGDDPATAGDDPLVDHGCTCTGAPQVALPLLFLAPLLTRRRRLRGPEVRGREKLRAALP